MVWCVHRFHAVRLNANIAPCLTQVHVPTSQLRSLVDGCLRFTMHFFHGIQQSASHIYHSALPLSPESSTFRLRTLRKTRITKFHGRPNAWGVVLRTITAGSKRFTSMTTFSHKIAAACDDDTVAIYDSVTGVLQLSLNPANPIQSITGSPSGSILFCAHKTPSITVWDIQTGGLIHTLILDRNAEDIAVSLRGRYLACGLSDGSVEVWGVADKMEGAAAWSSSPATCVCWLKPEEQLAVSTGTSARIWDIVAGAVLHSFTMSYPIHHMVYSRKFNRLAMAATSEPASHHAVTIINPQTGTATTINHIQQDLTHFAFSQTAEELVCGKKTGGIRLLDLPTKRWRKIEIPDAITSLSPLPNGTLAAHFAGSGIQLLSLDEAHAKSQQPDTVSALHLHSLDQDNIIAVLSTSRNCIVLLEAARLSQLLEIPVEETHTTPTHRTRVLCASLNNRKAVCCFKESEKKYMQLHEWWLSGGGPKWTVKIGGLPSIGGISPSGARIVTFYDVDNQTCICVWGTQDGELEAQLRGDPIHPLEVTFKDARFYSHHDTYRIPYELSRPSAGFSLSPRSKPTTLVSQIVRHEPLPLVDESQRRYDVDEACQWVISDSKRICWIPPGYIGSVQPSYCWAGSSLFMAGQDGRLRKLTFQSTFQRMGHLYIH